MLKLLIQNTISTEYESVEEIWRKVNDGLHERNSLERTLRRLSEDGLVEQAEGRPLMYRKIIKQTQLL